MRIKLSKDQLKQLSRGLPFEVMLDRPGDVRGLLDLVGKDMPWDETGISKFGNSTVKPARVTFGVEESADGFICDIHPAMVQYIHTLLTQK